MMFLKYLLLVLLWIFYIPIFIFAFFITITGSSQGFLPEPPTLETVQDVLKNPFQPKFLAVWVLLALITGIVIWLLNIPKSVI